jgi:hypothetical protein
MFFRKHLNKTVKTVLKPAALTTALLTCSASQAGLLGGLITIKCRRKRAGYRRLRGNGLQCVGNPDCPQRRAGT